MLDDVERYEVVYREVGGVETWAVYHPVQGVYLCTQSQGDADAVASLLNSMDVICIAEE